MYVFYSRFSVDEDPSINEISYELLKLKDEYRMKKLFTTKYDKQNATELATLRFKIRMIETGVMQVD